MEEAHRSRAKPSRSLCRSPTTMAAFATSCPTCDQLLSKFEQKLDVIDRFDKFEKEQRLSNSTATFDQICFKKREETTT